METIIPVNMILDAGIVTQGKMPDIYWDLDLNGSEIKILRYIYNNCLRLYATLRCCPKGKDGSPRFWRGKERMADDCGVSYPTFRNSVRHLSSMGLVTSMDITEDDTSLYCVGLSNGFVNGFIKALSTEKDFRSDSLNNLISLIYDNLTYNILNNQINLDKLPLYSLREYKLCETQSLCNSLDEEVLDENSSVQNSESLEEPVENPSNSKPLIKRQPIQGIKRQPIKIVRISVVRKAIISSEVPEKLRLQTMQEKLKLLQHVRTPLENHVLEVIEYYEYKCRQAIHSTGFRAIGKDFRNHKNWKFFVQTYKLCEEHHWDFHVYIDAQFDRVKYWQRRQMYPYANQLFSDGAQKYYHSYVKDYKEKNSVTGDIKVKSSQVKSVSQQIIDEVIRDCERMQNWMFSAQKRRSNAGLNAEQLKILYLSDHWAGLSVSYLANIPWFLQYLEQFPSENLVEELKQEIRSIQSSKKLMKTIGQIVSSVELQMGLPKTLSASA